MKLVMSTSALIGRRPIEVRRFCSHSGDGPFLTPRTSRSAKPGHSLASSTVTFTGQGNSPLIGLIAGSLNLPMSAADRSRAMPCTPVQSCRLGVRLISITGSPSPAHCGVTSADRRIGRQFHDAVMVFGNLQFGRRAQHAAALDAADGADAERDVLAGNVSAGRREYADEPGARIRRTADHLHRRATVAGIDHADTQPIGIRMLLGRNHPRDRERRKRLRLVLDVLDLEPDHGELVGELFQRLVGVEMFLQPGEREFHDRCFSCSLSRLRGRVRVGALAATAAAIVSRTPARLVMTS